MQAIRYRMDNGARTGLLVKQTPTKLHLILMEPDIHVRKVPRSELRYISPLNVPVNRVKKRLKNAARSFHHRLSRECRSYLR